MPVTYSFTLNGQPTTVEAEPKDSVLDVLRETLGVLTMKGGCAPQGLCGCCTVLVEGKARLTCTLPVKSLEGKSVTTLEGIPRVERDRVATAFAACSAAQCGYCTPGIALSTCALLAANTSPTDEELHRALAPHTCRCTGYTAILEGMRLAAECARDGAAVATQAASIGGEATELVLGARPFVDDLVRTGMLHAAVVFAPVATGTVATLDLDVAREMSGVRGVLAAVAVGHVVRHAGEVVAVVAAESMAMARLAAAAVVVQLEPVMPVETTVVAAGRRSEGDVLAALAACAYRAEVDVTLAPTDAVPLEPEAALAVPLGEGLVVYSAGHDAAAVAAAISEQVAGPVEVVLVPSGGSYGAKSVATVEVLAARMAALAGAPVRLSLDHVEGTRLRPRRAGARVVGTAGADAKGHWKALKLAVTFDGGALCHDAERYVSQALEALAYAVEAVEIEVKVERSGSTPTGAIRGAGSLAVSTGVEALVEQLVVATKSDALAFRLPYALGEGRQVLAALSGAYSAAEGARGLSLARAEGESGARVLLTVISGGEVEVQCNVPELGQGRDAALLNVLSETTGLDPRTFSVAWGRSAVVGAGGGGPVDEAARNAGAALREAGGELKTHVGRRFVGVSGRATQSWAAHLVTLQAEGGIDRVYAAAVVGEQDERSAKGVLEGSTAMGVGIACSEEVVHAAGLPEARFRYLGTLKSKVTPTILGQCVRLERGARDVAEVGVGAAAAVMVAVSRHEGAMRTKLPMKDSGAAKSVGVRIR